MYGTGSEGGVFGSLKEAILAESMVEVLEDLPKKQTLRTRDKKVLTEATAFLQLAKKGKDYTKTLHLDEHATESCSAYGRTLRALDHLAKENPNEPTIAQSDIDTIFDDVTRLLREIKACWTPESTVEKNKWTFLKLFFRALRDTIIGESVRAPEDVSIKRGLE